MHWLAFHTDAFVLFKFWKTSTPAGLLSAMVVACCVTCVYELQRFALTRWDRYHRGDGGNKRTVILYRLWRSFLQSVGALGSYVIMLFLMTYDMYVFLATVVGAAIGFFFFAPLFVPNEPRAVDAPVEGKMGSDGYALYSRSTSLHEKEPPRDTAQAPLLTSYPVFADVEEKHSLSRFVPSDRQTDV